MIMTEVIAVAHSCRKFFLVIYMVTFLGDAIHLSKNLTTMHLFIHDNNAGGLTVMRLYNLTTCLKVSIFGFMKR